MMTTRYRFFAALLAATLVADASAQSWSRGAAAPSPSVGALEWRKDIESAKTEAKQTDRLVLVHFWAPWCGPCRALDSRVFSQPAVAGSIQQKFVPVKINADDHAELTRAYGVTQLPTDVVLDANGQVVQKLTSPSTPMEYVGSLSAIASKFASRSGSAFQLAAANSPYGAATNNAYANLEIPPAQTPQAPASVSAPPAQQPPQQVQNPYAGQQAPVAPNQPTPPPATQSSARPQLPPGSPPLGFDGYCPVTMKQRHEWKQGDIKWGALHRGRTYLFVGQAERDAFLADAERFSPVFSGDDAVVALDEGRSVAGKREYGIEYGESIYLFSSEQSLRKFAENPEAYAEGVRQAMASATQTTLR